MRDPRVDPRVGDELRLLGWRIRVRLADDLGIAYLRDCPAMKDGLVEQSPADWRATMAHAEVIHAAGEEAPVELATYGRGGY
jgi:hypothetical protein